MKLYITHMDHIWALIIGFGYGFVTVISRLMEVYYSGISLPITFTSFVIWFLVGLGLSIFAYGCIMLALLLLNWITWILIGKDL